MAEGKMATTYSFMCNNSDLLTPIMLFSSCFDKCDTMIFSIFHYILTRVDNCFLTKLNFLTETNKFGHTKVELAFDEI